MIETRLREAVAKKLYEFGLRLTKDRIVNQDKWGDLTHRVKESWKAGAVSIINIFKEQGWRPPEVKTPKRETESMDECEYPRR